MTCGVCGGPMTGSGADQRLMCSCRRDRGNLACTNAREIKSAEIEARVLVAIKNRLLAPERVAVAVTCGARRRRGEARSRE
ncbi:zinc ribbon domain-containing protein [Brevundimonas nasdae]|uniref:zinc ribbon domain-containing protein n=1 Tax=Brevundimonas nasdae TaxID=172043 RepID=UPI003C6CE509